MTSCKTET